VGKLPKVYLPAVPVVSVYDAMGVVGALVKYSFRQIVAPATPVLTVMPLWTVW
jgi:hypothetical protein